jgi:hypothetical protein
MRNKLPHRNSLFWKRRLKFFVRLSFSLSKCEIAKAVIGHVLAYFSIKKNVVWTLKRREYLFALASSALEIGCMPVLRKHVWCNLYSEVQSASLEL